MLNNYEKLSNGVIKQLDRTLYTYDYAYVDNYNKIAESVRRMSYLRLGFLLGSINYVPDKLLDVGYGNGDFLKVAKDIIPKCFGTDTAKHHELPENVQFLNSDKIYDEKFDVICFFDALEHFHDIYAIKELKTTYIAISVPNCDYKSDEWFDTWKHRKPDEHLWFFNKESLIQFFDEIGYDCIHTSYLEDLIRIDSSNKPNILSGIFKKKI